MKIPQSCLTAPNLISPSNYSFKYTQFALWPLHLPRPPIKTRKTYKRFEAARSCGEPLEDPEMYNSLKQWKFAARGLRHEIRRGQRAREFNYREINYDMATWLFCRAGANTDEPTSFRKRAAAVASNSERERERESSWKGWLAAEAGNLLECIIGQLFEERHTHTHKPWFTQSSGARAYKSRPAGHMRDIECSTNSESRAPSHVMHPNIMYLSLPLCVLV